MNQHATKIRRSTVALLCLIGLQSFILMIALDCSGWFEAPQVILFVVVPVLLTFLVAWALRRYLTIPAWQQGVLTFVALLFVWQLPVTKEPRFFAAASRVQVGMTVTDAWTRLHPYVMARNNTVPGASFADKETAAVAKGMDPHFSGTLTAKSHGGSYSYQEFTVKNGIVTGSRRFFLFD